MSEISDWLFWRVIICRKRDCEVSEESRAMYQNTLNQIFHKYDLAQQDCSRSASEDCTQSWHTEAAVLKQQHLSLISLSEVRKHTLLWAHHMQCLCTDLWRWDAHYKLSILSWDLSSMSFWKLYCQTQAFLCWWTNSGYWWERHVWDYFTGNLDSNSEYHRNWIANSRLVWSCVQHQHW